MRRLLATLALLAAAYALPACSSDGPRDGPATAEPPAPRASAESERLVARLRDYVYAAYEVDVARSESAVARLKAARDALADAMTAAGIEVPPGPLAGDVPALRDHFLRHGDLVFVPLGQDAAGVLLVRVADRRDVRDRDLAGRAVSYRAIAYDDAAIDDLETWRRRSSGGPPARPVARAVGRALYIDRGVARRIATDAVIARAAHARDLEQRAAAGEPLALADEKDLLRHRALEADIARGPDAVAAAIAREEETRLAALIAVSPDDAAALADVEAAARVERDATLVALIAGEPRYHLASAIAATLAIPGTPAGVGAQRALALFTARPLHAWKVEELRAAARAALGK